MSQAKQTATFQHHHQLLPLRWSSVFTRDITMQSKGMWTCGLEIWGPNIPNKSKYNILQHENGTRSEWTLQFKLCQNTFCTSSIYLRGSRPYSPARYAKCVWHVHDVHDTLVGNTINGKEGHKYNYTFPAKTHTPLLPVFVTCSRRCRTPLLGDLWPIHTHSRPLYVLHCVHDFAYQAFLSFSLNN